MSKSVSRGWVNSDIKMMGKTVLITGANTGIGLESAIDFVKREARVILGCRNIEKAEEAKKRIVAETGGNEDKVILKQLDLASFASVRAFAKDVNENESRIDVLLNNAGIMMCPKGKTEDGFETQYGVNHLGHFLLTNLLLDLVKRSAPSRIVNVSSIAHRMFSTKIDWDDMNYDNNYSETGAYGRSKLMNILFTRELSRRLEGTNVTANSLHPGSVNTDLQRHVTGTWSLMGFFITPYMKLFGVTAKRGAQTNIYLSVAPELENVTGKYFTNCVQANESDQAKNDEDAKRLWEVSLKATGLSESS
uniref:Retinol dehydrogenase 14-like n=1 Tax=Ciona intestinalis TaxID=7719 RepID=F6XUY3_CIOIN|nr:retinol dehydrogenase 14-like [Ciona intestinalis]|eukprot:XP_002130502.1 retinol dehydrogenase 14-like [Ciona intestinalis]